MIFPTTPSQTVGPYFAIGLPWDLGPYAVAEDSPGPITISGMVYDGQGEPVPDHLVETWQADPSGRFADLHGFGGASELEGFRGFARYGVEDGDGSFRIVTPNPVPCPAPPRPCRRPTRRVSVRPRNAPPVRDPDLLRR